MSDSEARALRRAAILLLLTSAVRWGWSARQGTVPGEGREVLAALADTSRQALEDGEARSRPLASGERIDPNRASERDLDRLPGVGPAAAKAIVRFREEVGPFRVPGDLTRVRGIGPATLERIRPHLGLSDVPLRGAPRGVRAVPLVDVNRADPEELRALPGIGPALAARIVEERQKGPFRSVEELSRVAGIGPATVARLRARVTVGH
jgi:competence ComEA-like helix-hairpin-helix protein